MHNIFHRFKSIIKYHKYPLILFFLLSLIPLTWLHGYPVGFYDNGIGFFFFNHSYFLRLLPYFWSSSNMGLVSYVAVYPLPFVAFFQIFFLIIRNYFIVQEIFFICIIFFSLLFFYLFSQNIIGSPKYNRIISTLSAIFYVFNSFTITNLLFNPDQITIVTLLFIPLFLFLFIKGIKFLEPVYILIISLVVSYFAILNEDFFYFCLPIILLTLLLFVNEIFKNFNNRIYIKKITKYFLTMFVLSLLVNSWWIIFFYNLMFKVYSTSITHLNYNGIYRYIGSVTNMYILLRSFMKNFNNFPEMPFFYNPIFVLIGTLISFIILIPIIKESKKFILYISIFILGVFLVSGYNAPFKGFKLSLFEHLPFHAAFYEIFAYVPLITVSSSILFGFGIIMIYEFLNKKINKTIINKLIIIFLILIINFIYVFPLWNGTIFNSKIKQYGQNVSRRVDIPSYYKNISTYFNQDKLNYNILSLPVDPKYYRLFKWKYGFYGNAPLNILYSHREISSIHMNFFPQNVILKSFQNNKLKQISKMCSIFSIKYIVIQKDIYNIKFKNNFVIMSKIHYHFRYISTNNLLAIINDNNDFKFVSKFGRLNLYKIRNRYFINSVYSPTTMTFISSSSGSFRKFAHKDRVQFNLHKLAPLILNVTTLHHFNIRNAIFFTRVNTRRKNYELYKVRRSLIKNYKLDKKTMIVNDKTYKIESNIKNMLAPTLEFKEINPTKYIVIAHNVQSNFPVVFNQMYSKSWNLYIKKFNKKSLSQKNMDNYQCREETFKDCMNNKALLFDIKIGDISYTGNKFISKDFNGTIQNDNLPSGHILQTIFQRPYPHKYHFIANGYANSWWINLNDIKKLGPQYYKVNKNGTYDFEFIIDFWPQRLFYIGLIISGTTVVVFVLYLIYDSRKRKKKESD